MRSLLLLPLIALAACRPEQQAAAPEPPRPVQIATVRLVPAETTRAFTGTLRARHEADIGFRTGGHITERAVELGQAVAAGDLLFRLDPADLALALDSAAADLAGAEATARQAAAEAQRSRTLLAAGHARRAAAPSGHLAPAE